MKSTILTAIPSRVMAQAQALSFLLALLGTLFLLGSVEAWNCCKTDCNPSNLCQPW